jgi:hypothetical protein
VSTAIAIQELVILSESEELPMTMQVGMVAQDGILLASDTLSTRQPIPGSPIGAVWFGYNSQKILISEDSRIAVTCARDMMLASRVAEALINGLPSEVRASPQMHIRNIASVELSNAHENEIECLIALLDPAPALFHLQCLRGGSESYCPRITTFAFAGDRCNSSIFWAMRYYEATLHNSHFVLAMAPLASQIILDAAKMNSGSIRGLEIVYSDASGFHRMPEPEIRRQEEQAAIRSKKIERLLYGSPKKFRDRPLV